VGLLPAVGTFLLTTFALVGGAWEGRNVPPAGILSEPIRHPGAPGGTVLDLPPPVSADTLQLRLEVSDTTESGGSIPVILRVQNASAQGIDLYLRGRDPTFDLVVRREGDPQPLWRRLEGEVIPAIVRVDHLEAGGTMELHATWPQVDQRGGTLPPGRYTLQAELLTEGAPLPSEPRVVEIVP
jgi:hypothetical protein